MKHAARGKPETPSGENPGDFSCYFPVNAAAVGRGLYLTSAGMETIGPGYREYPRNEHPAMYGFRWEIGRVLTSFTLIECQTGRGLVELTRGEGRTFSEGEVLMIPPDVWHRYRPARKTGWRVAWVKVAGHSITKLVNSGVLPKQPSIVRPANHLAFRHLMDHLLATSRANPNAHGADGALMALAVLALCDESAGPARAQTTSRPDTGDALVDSAVLYIWNHSHRVLDVPVLAERMGVSRRTLETRFQRALGATILQEINRVRLERAEELLANTQVPVSDVVGLSGFGSAEAMRKTFLKQRGMRPSDVRIRPTSVNPPDTRG